MLVQALGYVGLHATQLADWGGYGTGFLGLQLAEKSSQELVFRMDDRRQRLVVAADQKDEPSFFGWEVADAAALDAIAARLEAAGTKVIRGDAALADRRHVRGLIICADPLGNRVELFHGAEIASTPFQPGRCISGFRTGTLGMGHAVLLVKSLDAVLPFYRDVLGFGVSDWIATPLKACFMHVNGRHHSLALIEGPQNALHHLMMELYSLDDVGQGYDLALAEPNRIATTLGRHTNDFMTSFYARTPGGFLVEYGWGGRVIDPPTWQSHECTHGPSLWGHDRADWTPERQALAGTIKRRAAEQGQREPVQVMAGNYTLTPGVCPWWDDNVRQAAE